MDHLQRSQASKKLVRRLIVATMAIFGFGFALVPLYNVFCDITGLNGKTGAAIDAAAATSAPVDDNRLITVEFLATVKPGLPWDFRPVTTKMRVHPGEISETHYIARNRSKRDVTGQAIPSVAPGIAAKHDCRKKPSSRIFGSDYKEEPMTKSCGSYYQPDPSRWSDPLPYF